MKKVARTSKQRQIPLFTDWSAQSVKAKSSYVNGRLDKLVMHLFRYCFERLFQPKQYFHSYSPFSFPIPRSPFSVHHTLSPFPVPHSPFTILRPDSPFPILHSPFPAPLTDSLPYISSHVSLEQYWQIFYLFLIFD